MADSVWVEGLSAPRFPALKGDTKTDVLIIGGGLAGLLCAYKLHQEGINYTLVEQKRICGGITHNTTAKITAQHGLIYDKLTREFSAERAKLYYKANQNALSEYRKMCKTIDCDFEEKDNYIYSTGDITAIENELKALQKIGAPARYVSNLSIPIKTVGAVMLPNQAQFNPLKFAFEIAKNLNIYEHTKVTEIGKNEVKTTHGKIKADKVVVATHFPILNKHGLYFIKLYQHRSYVIALKNAQKVDGMYLDNAEKGLSFRDYNDLLILGGGSHKTGKSGGNWRVLESFAKKYYPNSSIAARWATQDCMTLDGAPYIGRYSKATPNLFTATGFNKWGMSSSMAAAELITNQILGKESPYEEFFSPQRTILRPQLFVNAASAVMNILTPTAPRCPHLGCALKYNKDEHSWDCPCHGSRFSDDGALIDNPSTDDAKSVKKAKKQG